MNRKQDNRGAPLKVTDEEMKKMALQIKHKLGGAKITPSLLQTETGIGRMTWSRRMKDTIEILNRPLIRNINLNKNDEIFLPNIEDYIDRYWEEKNVLKNELLIFETILYELYEEVQKYKEQIEKLKRYEEENKKLKNELIDITRQAKHFESLYAKITVSSHFTHLRQKVGAENKLLDFKSDVRKNSGLFNLDLLFPQIEELTEEQYNIEYSDNKLKEQNIETISNKFNGIFKNENDKEK